MAEISRMFPITARAVRRLKLTLAEYWLVRCQRDRLDLGQNVSEHDSQALRIANQIRDFRNGYYGR